MVDIIINTNTDGEVEVEEKNNLEKDIFVSIYNEDGEDEFFAIQGTDVYECISTDIDLNSRPTLVRVFNHIKNCYGVEI